MDKRVFLQKIRAIFIYLGFVCLVTSAIMIIRVFSQLRPKTVQAFHIPAEANHRVLFLCSYDPLYFTYEAQRKGLEKVLYPRGIEYDVIFMNSREWNTGSDMAFYRTFLESHLSGKKHYDGIFAGDDAALKFVLEYQDVFFKDLPIVFFGINDLELAEKGAKNPFITGYFEYSYFVDTLNLARKIFPERNRIVALRDKTNTGIVEENIFKEQKDNYPDCIFVNIDTSSLSHAELSERLEMFGNDAVIFYMTCFSDKNGLISMATRTNILAKHAKVPIFRSYIGAEGEGVFGGVALDFEKHCELAAKTMADVLSGADISTIPLNKDSPARISFDYMLAKKYGVDFSLIPKNAVFFNKPESFLEHYGSLIPPISLLALSFLFFLGALQASAENLQLSNKELTISHDNLAKSQAELLYKTEHDEVLDIYNRRTSLELIAKNFSQSDVYSVVVLDIDGFKELNENYGHQVADSVLQYLVAEFKEMEKKRGWFLARFGGDEFLIVIRNEHLSVSEGSVKEIFDIVRTPVPLGDESISITVSMGISNSDGITKPVQHVINAEVAMYEAKDRGKNGAFIYGEEMKERMREEGRIKDKLLEAFDNNGFYMLYQPQINAETKEVSGYEALVRMKTPGIFPGQFIPVAERSGWIWRIGRITTELVIKQLSEWKAQGKTLHPVSVNFSSNQLNDYGYIGFVEDLLKKYDVEPSLLEIEITEGLFLEKSVLADQIFKRFKEKGIRLLMDDFGTGYSSLGYLTYIPVDVIKLDKSLVDTYLVEGKDSFIRNIINLMHDLGKEMIIEGVEHSWQFNRLREFGADVIQGYYFSKPISAEEAIDFAVKTDGC